MKKQRREGPNLCLKRLPRFGEDALQGISVDGRRRFGEEHLSEKKTESRSFWASDAFFWVCILGMCFTRAGMETIPLIF